MSAESTLVRLGRASAPLMRNRAFAAATGLGIRYEALWRQLLDAELGAVGVQTPDRRRRRTEREQVKTLRPELARPVRRPVVHWHEGGEGPALLLLNGWTASGLLWPSEWINALEQRFRVIRIDNRGTGWSRAAPAPYTMAELADDARDVLRACGIDTATVLGLSMGGMIAQEFALRHSDLVDRLLLVATAPPLPDQLIPDIAPFLAALRGPAAGQDLDDYFRELWAPYTGGSFADDHPEVMAEIVDQIRQRVTPRRRVFDQLRAIRAWQCSSRLQHLLVPTTVVHGNRDPLIQVGNGMRLARLIPDARYVELPGVGHLVPHEAGEELLGLIS